MCSYARTPRRSRPAEVRNDARMALRRNDSLPRAHHSRDGHHRPNCPPHSEIGRMPRSRVFGNGCIRPHFHVPTPGRSRLNALSDSAATTSASLDVLPLSCRYKAGKSPMAPLDACSSAYAPNAANCAPR